MTPLDRLLAESEITKLITKFAVSNDAGDWSAAAAMFAPDGRFTRPTGGDPVIGPDAIRESFASRPARKSCHLLSNIVVDVTSDTEAVARCSMLLFTAPAGEMSAGSPGLIGGYRDKLVRTTDGWRFAERVGFLDLKVEFK